MCVVISRACDLAPLPLFSRGNYLLLYEHNAMKQHCISSISPCYLSLDEPSEPSARPSVVVSEDETSSKILC